MLCCLTSALRHVVESFSVKVPTHLSPNSFGYWVCFFIDFKNFFLPGVEENVTILLEIELNLITLVVWTF